MAISSFLSFSNLLDWLRIKEFLYKERDSNESIEIRAIAKIEISFANFEALSASNFRLVEFETDISSKPDIFPKALISGS